MYNQNVSNMWDYITYIENLNPSIKPNGPKH